MEDALQQHSYAWFACTPSVPLQMPACMLDMHKSAAIVQMQARLLGVHEVHCTYARRRSSSSSSLMSSLRSYLLKMAAISAASLSDSPYRSGWKP